MWYDDEQDCIEDIEDLDETWRELQEDYEDCLEETEFKGFFDEEYQSYFSALNEIESSLVAEAGFESRPLVEPTGLIVERVIEDLIDHDERERQEGFDSELDESSRQALIRELVKRDIEQAAFRNGSTL